MLVFGVTLGLLTGTLLGLLGGGGSIIAVPIMVYVLGFDAKTAIATSLVVVGIASFLAAISHYRRESVLIRTAIYFGVAGAFGSFFGALIGKQIPNDVQLLLFSVVAALTGYLMIRRRSETSDSESKDAPKNAGVKVFFAGFGSGILTGLLGVGGGFIIVPALTFVVGLSIREAVGTSLVVIGMNSLVGAATYSGFIRWGGNVMPYVVGTLAAAPIAGHFSQYVRQRELKTVFAVTLLAISAFMFVKQMVHF
ncbi:sulfite exporter TauE/SafE family protein [Candidatus Obscuribacterales bacterium]|nr:sulfite exporter TauE/SafE family protein [Candidatus Obscuribacterales bacterium]